MPSRVVRLEDQLMTVRVMHDHVAAHTFFGGPHHPNPCVFEALAEWLEPSDGEYCCRWFLAINQVEAQSGITDRELEKLTWLLSANVQAEQSLVELP